MAKDVEAAALYNMQVHDLAYPWNATYEVIRVPGGWMYTRMNGNAMPSSCFVPFDNEFQPQLPAAPLGRKEDWFDTGASQ